LARVRSRLRSAARAAVKTNSSPPLRCGHPLKDTAAALRRGCAATKAHGARGIITPPIISHNSPNILISTQQGSATGRSVSDEYRRWVFSHMPALGRLLDNLDAGNTPTFLDIMTAISEMVALYTECDSFSVGPLEKNIIMSLKYCRFCC